MNTSTCYYENVINTDGAAYSTAYFEVAYLKVFSSGAAANASSSTTASSSGATSPASSAVTTGAAGGTGSGSGALGAYKRQDVLAGLFSAALVVLAGWTVL